MDITLNGLDEEKSAAQRGATVRGFLLAFLVPCLIGALLVGFSLAVLYGNNEQVGPIEAAGPLPPISLKVLSIGATVTPLAMRKAMPR